MATDGAAPAAGSGAPASDPGAAAPASRWRNWQWPVAGLAALVVLYLLGPILMPFVVGAGLAYVGDPIVDRLQRWGLSRTAGVCVLFLLIGVGGLVGLLLVAPLLYQQFVSFLQNIPEWLRWVQEVALPKLGVPLPDDLRLDPASLRRVVAEHWSQAGAVAGTVWASVSKSSGAVIVFFANLLMVPVVTFYLLRDWDALVDWIRSVIPRGTLPHFTMLARETDEVLGAFLRGQLSVMAALAVFYTLGLWLAGLKLALLIGLGAGLVSFVPYLGAIVGIASAMLAMLVQTQELLPLVWVALVFGLGQVLESMVLTPLLVGDRIGLHPVAVIFAVMAGGQLFGFVGVLLALPTAAVVAVVLRHAKENWLRSPWYLGEGMGPQPVAAGGAPPTGPPPHPAGAHAAPPPAPPALPPTDLPRPPEP